MERVYQLLEVVFNKFLTLFAFAIIPITVENPRIA